MPSSCNHERIVRRAYRRFLYHHTAHEAIRVFIRLMREMVDIDVTYRREDYIRYMHRRQTAEPLPDLVSSTQHDIEPIIVSSDDEH